MAGVFSASGEHLLFRWFWMLLSEAGTQSGVNGTNASVDVGPGSSPKAAKRGVEDAGLETGRVRISWECRSFYTHVLHKMAYE